MSDNGGSTKRGIKRPEVKVKPTWARFLNVSGLDAPVTTILGAICLSVGGVLFALLLPPLLDPVVYSGLPALSVVVYLTVLVVVAAAVAGGLLLAAFFAVHGRRWPVVAATFTTVVFAGIDLLYGTTWESVASTIAVGVGAVLLWLPPSRGFARATRERSATRLPRQPPPFAKYGYLFVGQGVRSLQPVCPDDRISEYRQVPLLPGNGNDQQPIRERDERAVGEARRYS
ncbi:hypothetical protein [Luethyella okanaganae]|uniref:Uncharacterized protein n=1 Tax=Luethyella okanaganae TaxID=69372 RepID=A0ABW1VDV1_9MICO